MFQQGTATGCSQEKKPDKKPFQPSRRRLWGVFFFFYFYHYFTRIWGGFLLAFSLCRHTPGCERQLPL